MFYFLFLEDIHIVVAIFSKTYI